MSNEKKVHLNEHEMKVLEVLGVITRRDGEMCVAFDYIMGETDYDRKLVRKACRSLARKGLAGFYRGLMNEDGEVAGSGYSISFDGEMFLNPCVECQERIADMNDSRCSECWNDRLCIKCGKAYREHPLENGYRKEFEFVERKQEALAL